MQSREVMRGPEPRSDVPAERASKSERKRRALSLQELGERLVDLPDDELYSLGLPEGLLDAVLQAKRITKRGGRKRQLQYIGVLMRHADTARLEEAFHAIEEARLSRVRQEHQIESWRDGLIRGDEQALEDVVHALPDADRARILALAERARFDRNKPSPSPAGARALYRYLTGCFTEKTAS